MRFGSLFSGIGGIDLGLERAGFECAWQVEVDHDFRSVLEEKWPNVKRYGDIRKIKRGDLEPVDLVAGGFPCQDVSLAGKRAGLKGARSGLWREFARILRFLRPPLVLVENTPGLLSYGMGDVLGDLARLGYDAEWESVEAKAFGAPYQRDRVFILAQLVRFGRLEKRLQPEPRQGGAEALHDHGLNAPRRPSFTPVFRKHGRVAAAGEAPGWRPHAEIKRCTWWDAEPSVARLVSRTTRGMDSSN